jgi:hypothetical protein
MYRHSCSLEKLAAVTVPHWSGFFLIPKESSLAQATKWEGDSHTGEYHKTTTGPDWNWIPEEKREKALGRACEIQLDVCVFVCMCVCLCQQLTLG